LDDFLTTGRLALATDQIERRAVGCRQRRIDQAPDGLCETRADCSVVARALSWYHEAV
jgi:hypothetical protein